MSLARKKGFTLVELLVVIAIIGIPHSARAARSVPAVGVSPPRNSAEFSSTRSAPPRAASTQSSAEPQHISSTILFIRIPPFAFVVAPPGSPVRQGRGRAELPRVA